jgi:hypothetical protein
MDKCPNCEKKLTPSLIDDFGTMIFMECVSCKVIWDYVSRKAAIAAGYLNASIRQNKKQANRSM